MENNSPPADSHSPSSTPPESEDSNRVPEVVEIVRDRESILEHTYGEGLHALLQNRPAEAVYEVGGNGTADSPATISIHRPQDTDHAFVVIDTESSGQFAFSGSFGDTVTSLLHLYRSPFALDPVTVPPELPNFSE